MNNLGRLCHISNQPQGGELVLLPPGSASSPQDPLGYDLQEIQGQLREDLLRQLMIQHGNGVVGLADPPLHEDQAGEQNAAARLQSRRDQPDIPQQKASSYEVRCHH